MAALFWKKMLLRKTVMKPALTPPPCPVVAVFCTTVRLFKEERPPTLSVIAPPENSAVLPLKVLFVIEGPVLDVKKAPPPSPPAVLALKVLLAMAGGFDPVK
jgi:hypothetical protein